MSELHAAVQARLAAFDPPHVPPFAAVQAEHRARRERRHRTAWGAAAALALTVATASGIAVLRDEDGTSLTTATPPPTVDVPAGTKPVGLHGVEIRVPDSWPVIPYADCPVQQDTVIIEDGGPRSLALRVCPDAPQPAGTTVVRISAASGQPLPGSRQADAQALASTPITVDGQPALRGTGTPERDKEQTVLLLPGPQVVISVEAGGVPAAEIFRTVRVRSTDSRGCEAGPAGLALQASDPARVRPPGADRLVPDGPTGATVCRYSGDRLVASFPLTPAEVAATAATLNGLPEGVTQPGPGYWAAPSVCQEDRGRGFVLRLDYPDATTATVRVRVAGCDGLTASNGVRTTGVSSSLVETLLQNGYDGGFPNPAELR